MHKKRTANYRLGPDQQTRYQIALMNEVLGWKKPIDFEEIDRMEKIKEMQRLLDKKKDR